MSNFNFELYVITNKAEFKIFYDTTNGKITNSVIHGNRYICIFILIQIYYLVVFKKIFFWNTPQGKEIFFISLYRLLYVNDYTIFRLLEIFSLRNTGNKTSNFNQLSARRTVTKILHVTFILSKYSSFSRMVLSSVLSSLLLYTG